MIYEKIAEQFSCPKDGTPLVAGEGSLRCRHGHAYPVVNGIPVLIDEGNSLFSIADIVKQAESKTTDYYWDSGKGLRALYRRVIGKVQNHTVHITALKIREAITRIFAETPKAKVLVIGSQEGSLDHPGLIYSDIYPGKNTSVILDAHSIPYPDGSLDAVIVIAVLEHVLDPQRCAQEITRVIKPGGYVYSSIPFLQPVHMGAYDFTRFTMLGHRRLWRQFEDISSGPDMGPATSTAFALEHVFLGLSSRPSLKKILRLFGIFVTAAIKPIDYLFRNRAGTRDAAASTYFFGRKSDRAVSDKDLIGLYRS